MVDHAALYGLIGAVSGAALGGGAAVIGPMLLHGRQADERREQALRVDQRERELAQREEEWRQRQFQQEKDHEQKTDREALIRRLINVRASTRGYQELLMENYWSLARGSRISLADFETALAAAHQALNSAFDEVLLDGVWFAHARPFRFFAPRGAFLRGGAPRGQGIDVTALGESLMRAGQLVAACIEQGPPIPDSLLRETEQALNNVQTERDELVVYLKGWIDAQWPE